MWKYQELTQEVAIAARMGGHGIRHCGTDEPIQQQSRPWEAGRLCTDPALCAQKTKIKLGPTHIGQKQTPVKKTAGTEHLVSPPCLRWVGVRTHSSSELKRTVQQAPKDCWACTLLQTITAGSSIVCTQILTDQRRTDAETTRQHRKCSITQIPWIQVGLNWSGGVDHKCQVRRLQEEDGTPNNSSVDHC